MKHSILFIGKIDPYNPAASGVYGYVMGLSRALKSKYIESTMIGYSSNLKTNGNFINILRKKDVTEYRFAFQLLMSSIHLKLSKSIPEYVIIHPQRADYALPFLFFKNPLILTLHGKAEEAKYKYGFLIYLLYSFVEKIVMRKIDAAIVVSEDLKDYYIHRYPNLRGKINVIHNGVDTSRFKKINDLNLREKYGFTNADKIIIYVGRIHPEKNNELLLQSLEIIKKRNPAMKVKLIIVGNGTSKNDLAFMRQVNELGLAEDVFLKGTVKNSDIPEILNCADVFALTSIVEGSPLVVLESLACGVPVVSTKVGDVSTVIKDGTTGYMVENACPFEFASKLELILTSNNDFSKSCIETAENYSWDNVADITCEIYTICEQKKSKNLSF